MIENLKDKALQPIDSLDLTHLISDQPQSAEELYFTKRRFKLDELGSIITSYCTEVLGFNNSQVAEYLAKFKNDVEMMDGMKWFAGDLEARAPYEHAHENQYYLAGNSEGYLALERKINEESMDAKDTKFIFRLKARSNPPNMSSDTLLEQDLEFFKKLKSLGYPVEEEGTTLSSFVRNKESKTNFRGKVLSKIIKVILIGEILVGAKLVSSKVQSGEIDLAGPKSALETASRKIYREVAKRDDATNKEAERSEKEMVDTIVFIDGEEYHFAYTEVTLGELGLIKSENPTLTISLHQNGTVADEVHETDPAQLVQIASEGWGGKGKVTVIVTNSPEQNGIYYASLDEEEQNTPVFKKLPKDDVGSDKIRIIVTSDSDQIEKLRNAGYIVITPSGQKTLSDAAALQIRASSYETRKIYWDQDGNLLVNYSGEKTRVINFPNAGEQGLASDGKNPKG